MSNPMTITVPSSPLVERLIGRRIRVQTPEFDGYGKVTSVSDTATLDLDLDLEVDDA